MVNRIILFSIISIKLFGAANEPVASRTRSQTKKAENSELINALRYSKKCINRRDIEEPMAKECIERGDFENLNIEEQRYAMILGASCCSLDMVRFMDKYKLPFSLIEKNGCNPLHKAALGDVDVLEHFLNQKIYDVNARDLNTEGKVKPDGRTPLHYVLRTAKGAVNKSERHRGKGKRHGYSCAAEVCKRIKLLSSYGANVNISDNTWGRTALHWSCHNDVAVMRCLLELKSDPNAQDNFENTVLNYLLQTVSRRSRFSGAESRTLIEKVQLLLDNGASVEMKNKKGVSPFTRISNLARKCESFKKIQAMFDSSLDCNEKDVVMEDAGFQVVNRRRRGRARKW